jgi:hypothetical protein
MKTLAQEYAEYSRQQAGDGSVSPTVDTGFRMPPTEPFTYTPRPNPPTKELWDIDTVHEDDITSKESTGIRGINFITIDVAKARARKNQLTPVLQ